MSEPDDAMPDRLEERTMSGPHRHPRSRGIQTGIWWAVVGAADDLPCLFESLRQGIENCDPDEYVVEVRVEAVDRLERTRDRLCPHCDCTLAQCYDWRREGRIACCPDCDHRAGIPSATTPA